MEIRENGETFIKNAIYSLCFLLLKSSKNQRYPVLWFSSRHKKICVCKLTTLLFIFFSCCCCFIAVASENNYNVNLFRNTIFFLFSIRSSLYYAFVVISLVYASSTTATTTEREYVYVLAQW